MNNNIPDLKSSNRVLYMIIIVVGLFFAALLTNGFGLFDKSSVSAEAQKPVEFVALSIGDSPVLGEADAPVTVYEFSDFSCPFCAAASGFNQRIIDTLKRNQEDWIPPLPSLKKDYVETGKVKLVYKYSSGHGTAQAAHLVGWCLNEQNLFWEFHDKAFENQDQTGNLEDMKNLAKEIGADDSLLRSCLDSRKYESSFAKDINMGLSNGVGGTPSYFVNGKLVSGAVSYPELKSVIDKELA